MTQNLQHIIESKLVYLPYTNHEFIDELRRYTNSKNDNSDFQFGIDFVTVALEAIQINTRNKNELF